MAKDELGQPDRMWWERYIENLDVTINKYREAKVATFEQTRHDAYETIVTALIENRNAFARVFNQPTIQ